MLNKLKTLRGKEEGFTLIELLIVVIIIGVLAAIALPIFIDQQKIAIDASVKSDVRNTVTNVTNMQAQQDVSAFKIARSNSNTVEVRVDGEAVAAASPSSTKTLTAPIALGTAYTVDGFNSGGKIYTGADKAYTFNSATGRFNVTDVSVASSWAAGSTRAYSSTFEDGNTSDTLFASNGTTFTNITDQANSGTHSLATVRTNGDISAGFLYKNTNPGTTYKYEGYYYFDTTATSIGNGAFIERYMAPSPSTTPLSGSDLTPNVWHKFSYTAAALYDPTAVRVAVYGGNNVRILLDDIKITPVN